MLDCRQDLINDILNECISNGIDVDPIKNSIWIVCDKYEITNRTTEVAVLDEDYNDNLIKKFLICKSVKGCTERTLQFYKEVLVKVIPAINKNIRDIEKTDIRLYIAKRQKIDKVSNAMYKAMFEIMLSTGCRVTELVTMKMDNINNDEVMIKGKGNKYRKVFLNAKAQIALEKYLAERRDSNPFVFCGYNSDIKTDKKTRGWWKYPRMINDTHIDKSSVEQIFKKIGRGLDIKRSNPHKFRRTCATLALKKGMPLEQVSRMLGHEQLDTTKIYLDLNDDELKAFHMKYVN